MDRTVAYRVRDPSTRTARALRRSAVRWFAVASSGWVLLVFVGLWNAGMSVPVIAAITAGSIGILVATVGYGLTSLLDQVHRLDQDATASGRSTTARGSTRSGMGDRASATTGLSEDELDEQITVARERDRPFALLFIDVDDLKKTNDVGGHAAGDRVLRATAGIITSNLRRLGSPGFRIGGDEFAVVLLHCDTVAAVTTARRMLASALEGGSGAHAVEPFSLTIGVSAFPGLAHDRKQLVHQADAALYWGKRHGRTDIQLFDPRAATGGGRLGDPSTSSRRRCRGSRRSAC